MTLTEVIGWMATAMTMASFLTHKMLLLRVMNFTACLIWVCYGIMTISYPVIVTNALIACIHLYWYVKNYQSLPSGPSSHSKPNQ